MKIPSLTADLQKFAEQVVGLWGITEMDVRFLTANALADRRQAMSCDATGGSFTVQLPNSTSVPGRIYFIWKSDSSVNTVTIDSVNVSDLFDGVGAITLTAQYQSRLLISTGRTAYKVMASI